MRESEILNYAASTSDNDSSTTIHTSPPPSTPLCLSDLPIPPPPPMQALQMTSRYDVMRTGFSTYRNVMSHRNSTTDLGGRAARPRCFGRYSMSVSSLRGPEFGSPLMSRAEFTLAPPARSWRMPYRPVIKVARCRFEDVLIH